MKVVTFGPSFAAINSFVDRLNSPAVKVVLLQGNFVLYACHINWNKRLIFA